MSVVLEDNAIPLKPNLFVKAKFYPKKYAMSFSSHLQKSPTP